MKTYLTILEELGWPKVYLVSDQQYRAIVGEGIYRDKHNKRWKDTYDGASGDKDAPIVTLRHNLHGKVLRNTIYHEVLHILFPWQPHWWIECAAEVMARGGGKGYYSGVYGHSVADLPKREELLKRIKRQVLKFNAKERNG